MHWWSKGGGNSQRIMLNPYKCRFYEEKNMHYIRTVACFIDDSKRIWHRKMPLRFVLKRGVPNPLGLLWKWREPNPGNESTWDEFWWQCISPGSPTTRASITCRCLETRKQITCIKNYLKNQKNCRLSSCSWIGNITNAEHKKWSQKFKNSRRNLEEIV